MIRAIACSLLTSGSLLMFSQDAKWGFATDHIVAITTDNAGNTYVVGSMQDSLDIDPTAGTQMLFSFGGPSDIVLAKYDPSGELLWGFNLDGPGEEYPYGIALGPNGDVYLVGQYSLSLDPDPSVASDTIWNTFGGANADEPFVARFDSNGSYIDVLSFDFVFEAYIIDLTIDRQGNRYLFLVSTFQIDLDPSADDYTVPTSCLPSAILAKYDSSWNLQWGFAFDDTTCTWSFEVAHDSQGNVYVTGGFTDSIDLDPAPGSQTMLYEDRWWSANCFLAKYDNAGTFQWGFRIPCRHGTTPPDPRQGVRLEVMDSAIHCLGLFLDTIDVNPLGTPTVLMTDGTSDVFMCSYALDGQLISAAQIGDSNNLGYPQLFVTEEGRYLAMAYKDSIDIDPGPSAHILKSEGANDYFVARYNTGWNPDLAINFGGVNGQGGVADLAVTTAGDMIVTGNYLQGQLDLGNTLLPLANDSAFLAKFCPPTTGIERLEKPSVSAYPNPTTGIVQLNLSLSTGRIDVFSSSGQRIRAATVTGDSPTILDLSDSPAGLYLVVASNNGQLATTKILVLK